MDRGGVVEGVREVEGEAVLATLHQRERGVRTRRAGAGPADSGAETVASAMAKWLCRCDEISGARGSLE